MAPVRWEDRTQAEYDGTPQPLKGWVLVQAVVITILTGLAILGMMGGLMYWNIR